MNYKLLHIFQNTRFGRETFLQSLYFCKTVDTFPAVYIPKSEKFLMYFSNDAVQVNLDASYLRSPDTARGNAVEIADEMGVQISFYEPKNFTASSLPDLPTNFDYLCWPQPVSGLLSKIRPGHLGPKVRRMIKHAAFPILITSPVFKPWKSISVFFGGSKNALNALKTGLKVSMASGLPMNIYTLVEEGSQADYRKLIKTNALEAPVNQLAASWRFYEKTDFDAMLCDVAHDSLIVLGACGHGVIKDLLLGSKMAHIRSKMANNLLITGPNCPVSLLWNNGTVA